MLDAIRVQHLPVTVKRQPRPGKGGRWKTLFASGDDEDDERWPMMRTAPTRRTCGWMTLCTTRRTACKMCFAGSRSDEQSAHVVSTGAGKDGESKGGKGKAKARRRATLRAQ